VALTDLGFVTWNVEYRRIGDPGGGWPGSFDDIARAARFVFEHAADLGIDPDRVVVLGHSAGGQLASWLASIANVPAGSSIRSTPLTIRGVVSLAGVLDLHEAWARDLSNGAVVDFLGGAPDEVPDRYAAASPFALLPSPAPHLVVHGTRDANVPAAISEAYATRAAAKGASVTSLILPGVDHFDIIDPESTVWPTIAAAIRNVIDSR
jgi:acetyl esterase/lipase